MVMTVVTHAAKHVVANRSFCRCALGRVRLASTKLPQPFQEITCLPRIPSWSLKELHEPGRKNAKDDVDEITEEKLMELAELCHLHIDPSEFLEDVRSIIQCTRTVQAVTLDANIDDVYMKPRATRVTPEQHAPLREDVVTEGDCMDAILSNARERSGAFFKVPKVLQE